MATTEKQTSESSGQGAGQARSGTYLLFSAVGVVLSVLYWNGRLAGAEQAGFNRMLLWIFFGIVCPGLTAIAILATIKLFLQSRRQRAGGAGRSPGTGPSGGAGPSGTSG